MMDSITVNIQGLREHIGKIVSQAQTVLAVECKKAADVYTPFYEGNLVRNFEWIKDGTGAIIGWQYREPYAHRQWLGTTESGDPFNYNKDRNPNARSRWTEHGAISEKDTILRAVMSVFK